jgi:porphobilinogen synthase
MPGVFQLSPDTALEELRRFHSLGGAACILFGITDPALKTPTGAHALNPDNEVCTTLKLLKDAGLPLLAITDLCFCEYTSHGHCGPLTGTQSSVLSPQHSTVANDPTIDLLGQQAVLHARAGADLIAPSAAMDNMVHAIRSALDAARFPDTAILSYAVKYASAFYGPFRDAAESPPQSGDRKSYQMDFRRSEKEALHEAALDVEQGADLLMVKPGTPYLDILRSVAAAAPIPTGAYHVSGEYAMIKAAAANGWIDEKAVVLETMHSFKRAGAAFILTYYAPQLAQWLNDD